MAIKSPFFESEQAIFICEDEDKLTARPEYQQVRAEINRKFSPLAGRVDWQKVEQLVVTLAQQDGVDLLLASYYCVAKTRNDGLNGLANGLELLGFALSSRWQHWALPINRRAELVNWLVAKCIDEIKRMRPEQTHLRQLYRCERALAAMHTLFEQASAPAPNLDSIGYWVFEAIDRIEHAKPATPVKTQVLIKYKQRWPMFVSGAVLGLLLVLPFKLPHKQEITVEDRINNSLTGPIALSKAQVKDVLRLHKPEELVAAKPKVTLAYQAKINSLLTAPNDSNLLQAEQLASALIYLYPDDKALKRDLYKIKYQQQAAIENLNTQYQRFAKARSGFANLNLAVEQVQRNASRENLKKVKQLSKPIYSYAIGLSPIMARLWYTEELLQKGQFEDAEKEIDKLELALDGVGLKLARLKQLQQIQSSSDEVLISQIEQ
ncbi:type VI secretion system ImpA family N-terminal domain-containing protein [Motilimonas sp. KMU-193]|uniref:type VI secretion system ImpA family N-terminal domain-containing protein n=1 Tax=Motilimonas sp. KMU-193 TaxID=3388668 RepID=UPI00396B1182